jgi:hypothetical protein
MFPPCVADPGFWFQLLTRPDRPMPERGAGAGDIVAPGHSTRADGNGSVSRPAQGRGARPAA